MGVGLLLGRHLARSPAMAPFLTPAQQAWLACRCAHTCSAALQERPAALCQPQEYIPEQMT